MVCGYKFKADFRFTGLTFISCMADSSSPALAAAPRSLTTHRPVASSKDRATPTRQFGSPRLVPVILTHLPRSGHSVRIFSSSRLRLRPSVRTDPPEKEEDMMILARQLGEAPGPRSLFKSQMGS